LLKYREIEAERGERILRRGHAERAPLLKKKTSPSPIGFAIGGGDKGVGVTTE
jgi:hypothetical protein